MREMFCHEQGFSSMNGNPIAYRPKRDNSGNFTLHEIIFKRKISVTSNNACGGLGSGGKSS
jgi:hypothetical protein